MEKLHVAESIDHFLQQVRGDPVNALSRVGHSYTTFTNETTEPWLLGTEIVTLHPSAEAGLPHTRPPNLICLPAYYPPSQREHTLAHELIHIDQRKRRPLWDAKFQRDGWQRLDTSEIPERWLRRCRMNPDTIDQRFWAWKGRYVPLPLFEREDRPQLRDVVIHWYDTESGVRQPDAPRSFLEHYGSTAPQPEHPRELTAVELSRLFQGVNDLDSYLST